MLEKATLVLPWGSLKLLCGVFASPLGFPEASLEVLGVLGASLGRPWHALGGSWGCLGWPRAVFGAPLGLLGSPWVVFGAPLAPEVLETLATARFAEGAGKSTCD